MILLVAQVERPERERNFTLVGESYRSGYTPFAIQATMDLPVCARVRFVSHTTLSTCYLCLFGVMIPLRVPPVSFELFSSCPFDLQ